MGLVASAHILDFRSISAALRWRRRLIRSRAELPGLRWVKAAAPIGRTETAGFGAGLPEARRQLVVAAWETRQALEDFSSGTELGAAWKRDCRHAWHVVMRPVRSRGSHHGDDPFDRAEDDSLGSQPMAALTLGRFYWNRVPLFTRQAVGLTDEILGAPGLITALSAGFPTTGNYTFSLWERTEDMRQFAYAGAHLRTVNVDKRRGMLREQLNARFVLDSVSGSWDPETTYNSERLTSLACSLSEPGPRVRRGRHRD